VFQEHKWCVGNSAVGHSVQSYCVWSYVYYPPLIFATPPLLSSRQAWAHELFRLVAAPDPVRTARELVESMSTQKLPTAPAAVLITSPGKMLAGQEEQPLPPVAKAILLQLLCECYSCTGSLSRMRQSMLKVSCSPMFPLCVCKCVVPAVKPLQLRGRSFRFSCIHLGVGRYCLLAAPPSPARRGLVSEGRP
jgi:hypothetical protein